MARKPKTEPAGLTTELVPDKVTPGTVRFTEEKGAPKVLPSIYIPKESLCYNIPMVSDPFQTWMYNVP